MKSPKRKKYKISCDMYDAIIKAIDYDKAEEIAVRMFGIPNKNRIFVEELREKQYT